MDEKKIIEVPNAPRAIGPYSQGVKFKNFMFISGQIGLDPNTNQLVGDDIEQQTKQCLENIKNIIETTGGTLFNILKVTIYLTSIQDFDTVNKIYEQYFNHEPPARACVQVAGLPGNALIEIEAIAHLIEHKAAGTGLF